MSIRYLRVASDLHLEWRRDTAKHELVLPEDELDKESCLVLAGDIGSGKPLFTFIEAMSKRFARVAYIPGNHEYYGCQSMKDWNGKWRTHLDSLGNVSAALGEVVNSNLNDKYNIVLATMWTDCDKGNPLSMMKVEGALSDFRAIPEFTVKKMVRIHKRQKEAITNALARNQEVTKKSIVVTHHMPSWSLISDSYKQYSDVNGGFAANCDNLFGKTYSPDVWIYGHTHDQGTSWIEKTLCVCNPLGYPGEASGRGFQTHLFLDLDHDPPWPV